MEEKKSQAHEVSWLSCSAANPVFSPLLCQRGGQPLPIAR
jgi:hypothetical protein